MAGLVVIVVVALGLALTMRIMADRIERGETQPNMGQHTQESTTAESWAAMRVAVAEAMRSGTRWYTAAAAIALLVAAWTGSGNSGAGAGGALLGIAAAPMVLGVIGARNLLVPNGPIAG